MAVEGIILAAGLSSRAKTYKMTMEFNNKTIIENVIDNMIKFSSRVIVVGGYRIEMLEPIIKKYKSVELVFNEKYNQGMFSSVIKGMESIREEKFFLTPGDYPLISPDVYKTLLENDSDIVIPTFAGRKGHPILMKSFLIKEILEGDYSNLREFIRNKAPVFVPVSCRGILLDIDTEDDYTDILRINRDTPSIAPEQNRKLEVCFLH